MSDLNHILSCKFSNRVSLPSSVITESYLNKSTPLDDEEFNYAFSYLYHSGRFEDLRALIESKSENNIDSKNKDIYKWYNEIYKKSNSQDEWEKEKENEVLFFIINDNYAALYNIAIGKFEYYLVNKIVRRAVLLSAIERLLEHGLYHDKLLVVLFKITYKTKFKDRCIGIFISHIDSVKKSPKLLSYLYNICGTSNEFDLQRVIPQYVSLEIKNEVNLSFGKESEVSNSGYLIKHINNIKNRRRKGPRVAICISGLFRNGHITSDNINEYVIKPLNADVFIDTWDIENSWSGFCGSVNLRRTFGKVNTDILPDNLQTVDALSRHYPETYKALSKNISKELTKNKLSDYFPQAITRIEKECSFENSLSEFDMSSSVNQYKMFYKIKRCHELMTSYEESNGIRYDYVIRLRPDLIFNKKITMKLLKSISDDVIGINNFVDNFGPNDQVAISTRTAMDKYASIWSQISNSKKLSFFNTYPDARSHKLMQLWLWKCNLGCKIVNISCGISASTSQGIPDIKDELTIDLYNNSDREMNEKVIEFFSRLGSI